MDRRIALNSRASSSTAYKKRNSSSALGVHKSDNSTFQVTNYRDRSNHADQFKVTLERVIGLTANTNAQITIDQVSGTVAYTAGCVAVLMGKNFQDNIINTSRKSVTALAFSADGKYLALGESGHAPKVRVYEASSRLQVSEFAGHKFGVTCVAFSPNNKYLVSIGTQHDMVTNVWNWRQGTKVASNKISNKVNGLAFSSNGTTFVTIGVRHVKYWFLDESKRKTTIQSRNETVPLLGRNGLLGEEKTNTFVDVACGKGSLSDSVYVISQNGTLCQLIDRQIAKTVELKTIRSYCIKASETLLIVGCANGIIRVFDAQTLHYIQTLHKPHPLGVDVVTNSMGVEWTGDAYKYPDTLGLVLNETDMSVTATYSDHSVYVWDLSRLPQIGRISASLYHSSCVWSVDVLPSLNILPDDTFITCSSDDTIRLWNLNPSSFNELNQKKPSFNYELLRILYTDPSLGSLCEQEYNSDKPDIYESRNGVKCVTTSPDGRHLASGDLVGNIRVHDLCNMNQIQIIEAHDAGVLCLEYSNSSNKDEKYLVSASRDRLIHIFDVSNEYEHLTTLSDHSSSILSVKLINMLDSMLMISISSDKSMLFRVSPPDQEEVCFHLLQNVVTKSTPSDMVLEPNHKYIATACQDRMVRLYNVQTGKIKRSYKGAGGDDGSLHTMTIDNTGTLLAVSCSDKSVAIIDFYTGEIVATLVGHSENITGLKFTNDGTRLISTSGDGCIFLWKLDDRLIDRMFHSALKRSNSEMLTQPRPDVTLVTPYHKKPSTPSSLTSGSSLDNHDDFDEKTFVVKQTSNHQSPALPSWAKESQQNGRTKWDKDRATPVMTSLKNGQMHMSPDSAQLANMSGNIIPIAVQSQVTVIPDQGNETDDDEDMRILTSGETTLENLSSKTSSLKLNINNNMPSYSHMPTSDSVIYYDTPMDDDEFQVTHRSPRMEDEKSSTSETTSHHTMESDYEGMTPASTPASSVPSTPVSSCMSPNTQLMQMLQHITANQTVAPPTNGTSSISPILQSAFTRVQDKESSDEPVRDTDTASSASAPARKESLQKNMRKPSSSLERRKLPTSQMSTNNNKRQYSSTESLTSTEELMAGSTLKESHADTSHNSNIPDGQSTTSSNSKEDSLFTQIEQLCTAMRSTLDTAKELYKQVEDKDSTEHEYLVETIRDVCDGFHELLPPTPRFEAIVHQTLHQFLTMNKEQTLLAEDGRKTNG